MIKINDNWYYMIEENQYILIHKYMKPKGVFGKKDADSGELIEKTEEYGYFQSVTGMCKRLAQIMCKEKADKGDITTLQQHIDALSELQERLSDICKGE